MNTPDLHSQRPDYQRENIDLAVESIKLLLSSIDLDDVIPGYNTERIQYTMGLKKRGFYDSVNDGTIIDISSSFNTAIHIHELHHAFSSGSRFGRNHGKQYRSGYRISTYYNGYTELSNQNLAFNEGLTELITLRSILLNQKNITTFRSKFVKLMNQYSKLAEISGDKKAKMFKEGDKNSGWLRGYYNEMKLVFTIIDVVSYKRSASGEELEEQKQNIMNDLIIGYFLGDFSQLRSLLKEADATGKLKKHIEELTPGDPITVKITNSIRAQIKDIFDPNYRMDSIPTKLS